MPAWINVLLGVETGNPDLPGTSAASMSEKAEGPDEITFGISGCRRLGGDLVDALHGLGGFQY